MVLLRGEKKLLQHTFRSGEMDHISILLEHVYLLNCLDWLDV